MSGYYAANPHYAAPDLTEQREREERALSEASRLFRSITEPQHQRYADHMAAANAYRNTPRWDRERAAADRAFKDSTTAAAALTEKAFAEIIADGEISQETYAEADAIEAASKILEASE